MPAPAGPGPQNRGVLLYLVAFLKRTVVKLAETCAEALEEIGEYNQGVKSFPQFARGAYRKGSVRDGQEVDRWRHNQDLPTERKP